MIGVSDAYRFEIRNPDGTVVHVRMEWAPVVLDADEKAEWQALLDWQWERQREFMAGEMEPVPDRKPAYHRMIGGLDGTMWVQRHAPVGTSVVHQKSLAIRAAMHPARRRCSIST